MFETMNVEHNGTEFFVFFCLNGYENGNRDFRCTNPDGTTLADGWYFGNEDNEYPLSTALPTMQDAVEMGKRYVENYL